MNDKIKKEWIDNNKSIAIIGSSNSGKTNLAICLAKQCSHKNKYLLGYPKPIKGFINLSDKDELFSIKDAVIVIDEFSRYFQRYDRHANECLEEALDFAYHRNIKLILTSQNNQAIDRNLESKIKCWAIKKINTHTLKQGGMCKIATTTIKDYRITSTFINLENNEFIWWSLENEVGENGIKTFENQNIPKDWNVE